MVPRDGWCYTYVVLDVVNTGTSTLTYRSLNNIRFYKLKYLAFFRAEFTD